MSKDDSVIDKLTAALQSAEQRLAQRDALVTKAIEQTETIRSQYEQANERAETLRRRLDARDEQYNTLQSQLETTRAELEALRTTLAAREQTIASLQKEQGHRDERIATLEQLHAEDDSALIAIHQDIKRQNLANPSEHLADRNLVLESLDEPGVQHRLVRTTTTLGRAPTNDIAINSTSVSRYHARIVIESDAVYLVDLKSTNGCSVNGRRAARQVVSNRDVLGIGDAKFRLTMNESLFDVDDEPMRETHVILDKAALHNAVHGAKSHAQSTPTRPGKK